MLVINCGNGGDYEYERDRAWWMIWIVKNITVNNFEIIPHKESDKAILIFESEEDAIIFKLIAPEYISPNLIIP